MKRFFDKAFTQWTRNIALLLGTYRGLSNHKLLQKRRENPTTCRRVAENNRTVLSMYSFKARMVQVRSHGYAMLDGFPDNSGGKFFNIVVLPLNQPDDFREPDERTEIQLLTTAMQMLNTKEDLNST